MLSLALVWGWFYNRLFLSLNYEAEDKLKRIAESVAIELKSFGSNEENTHLKTGFLKNLWKYESASGWIQNLYWVDVSGEKPIFLASFSTMLDGKRAMTPPTAEEVEDMVYGYINELEKGKAVMPDPFSVGDSRRFKIVLFPILDRDQMLESVVGVEADMEYLNLAIKMRSFFFDLLIACLLLSLFTALLLARNLSRKIRFLLGQLEKIEQREIPGSLKLHVLELDELFDGMINLAKQLKQQDEHLKLMFEKKLEELSFLGGSIAHEIRNPLSAIEVHFSLLKRHLARKSEDEPQAVKEIAEQLRHLRSLIENFLKYSRKVKPKKEKIELLSFVNALIANKKAGGNVFVSNLDIPENMIIDFDKTMLQQIFENILNNSIEACIGSDKELILNVKAENTGRTWKLIIENNGPAINEEIRQKLFVPFETSKEGGHGIGLALVKKLVEAHNGEISCFSSESGVSFVIEVINA